MESARITTQNTVSTLDEALENGRKLHDEAIGQSVAHFFAKVFGKLANEDALYGKTLGHPAQ